MMTRGLRSTVGLLALATLTLPASAQDARSAGARGWVGISYNIRTTGSALTGTSTTATISDVRPGSPARAAGLREGDVLISINGVGVDRAFGSPARTVRAGDPVTIVTERDGERRTFRLTAARVPPELDRRSPPVALAADSMVDAMVRTMDSVRLNIVRTGGKNPSLLRIGGGDSLVRVLRAPSGRVEPMDVRSGEIRAPFEFFVFRGEKYDSLRQEMNDLNRELRALQLRESRHLRSLAQAAEEGRVDLSDPELMRIRQARQEHEHRAVELRRAMEEAAEEGAEGWKMAGTLPARIQARSGREERGVFRPLTPYLLGRNRTAGAEVVELKPGLADYFEVEEGVLVVDVPDGTPAALAGIEPGDVITGVDGEAVGSIEEFRTGLARGGEALSVALVRKGRTLEVLLRR